MLLSDTVVFRMSCSGWVRDPRGKLVEPAKFQGCVLQSESCKCGARADLSGQETRCFVQPGGGCGFHLSPTLYLLLPPNQ